MLARTFAFVCLFICAAKNASKTQALEEVIWKPSLPHSFWRGYATMTEQRSSEQEKA
jgi:hypothetical protein